MKTKSNRRGFATILLLLLVTAGIVFGAVCSSCNGSGNGTFTCFTCGGSGLNSTRTGPCASCGGRRFNRCPTCNGTGQRPF